MKSDPFVIPDLTLDDPDQTVHELQDICNDFDSTAALEPGDNGRYKISVSRPVPIEQAERICAHLCLDGAKESFWPPHRETVTYKIEGSSMREVIEICNQAAQKAGSLEEHRPNIWKGNADDEVLVKVPRGWKASVFDTIRFVLSKHHLISPGQ